MHTSRKDFPSIPEFCRMKMCDPRMAEGAFSWVWDQIKGEEGGIVSRMPLGTVPPKAALCTMLFNPVYKVAFVRSTKVGGTSLMNAIGNNCKLGISWEELQVRCLLSYAFVVSRCRCARACAQLWSTTASSASPGRSCRCAFCVHVLSL